MPRWWAHHRALLPIDARSARACAGDDVVLHDTLRVGMTVPAPERTFTFAALEWDPSAADFLSRARRSRRASEGVDLTGGAAPDFA